MVRNLNKSETSLLIPIPTQTVKTAKHLKYLSKINVLNLKIFLTSRTLDVKYHSNFLKTFANVLFNCKMIFQLVVEFQHSQGISK